MAVRVQCAECGAEVIKPWPSAVKDRNFCNQVCLGHYRSKHYVGPRAAHWKGGVRDDRGRVQVHMPHHPSAQSNGYVYRYRLVAEETLGRPLHSNEIVHHIDGDETNDVPSNLQIMTQSEHARLHNLGRRKSCHVST